MDQPLIRPGISSERLLTDCLNLDIAGTSSYMVSVVSEDPVQCLEICLISNRLVDQCVIPIALPVRDFGTVLGLRDTHQSF
jgi:hypothetical protein